MLKLFGRVKLRSSLVNGIVVYFAAQRAVVRTCLMLPQEENVMLTKSIMLSSARA
jgi:hypothetical protein